MAHSAALLLLVPLALSAQITTTLSPKTTAEFEAYLKLVEPQISSRLRSSPLKPGDVHVEPVRGEGTVPVTDGLIHDWVAGMLVPGATPEQAIAALQNYGAYKNIYQPEVVDSKLLAHNGDQWRVYLKIIKKKVLTAVLNTEYNVLYQNLGQGHWQMTSRSTRIAELEDGKELPIGTGHGFLWRLNAYWFIDPRPNGVYLECRTISLSRDIPFGLGFAVGPFVRSLPPESLRATMEATVRALQTPNARPAQSSPTK